MPLDLEKTRDVLRRLMDLLAAGTFPHAIRPEDCSFCDFEAVCGGVSVAAARSRSKLEAATHPALRAFRELHDEG